MLMRAAIIAILSYAPDPQHALNTRLGAEREADIIIHVGKVYGLTQDQIIEAAAVRRVENGRPGSECGVGSEDPTHAAHRFADDPVKSLECQVTWLAGSIKHHAPETLESFAKRWVPNDWDNWKKNVAWYLRRFEGKGQ